MKYLIKFNESKLGDELEDLCQTYLSFLKDDGFECYVNSSGICTHITIFIEHFHHYPFPDRDKRFHWSEIEDDFIPFLQILSERYKIAYDYIILTGYNNEPATNPWKYHKVFSIKDVLKGEIPEYATCNSVTLQVDGKL
jgi:hypothetical protein